MRAITIAGAACACLTFLATPAPAQQTFHIVGMPDFDQRREGLPNGGSAYCVPASATNLMAYIANHGFGPIMDGPRNWQLETNAPFVTTNMGIMGFLMNTSPTGGTGGANWENGLTDFMNDTLPGQFVIVRRGVKTTTHQVHPSSFYVHHLWGGLVSFSYGRYALQPNGTYARQNGHAVALNGVENADSSSPVLFFRNSSSDSDPSFQSIFATASNEMQLVTVTTANGTFTLWELLTSATDGLRRLMTNYVAVHTAFVLTTGVQGQFTAINPVQLTTQTNPPMWDIPAPPNTLGLAVALHPDAVRAYVLHDSFPGQPPDPRISMLSLADGSFQPVPVTPAPRTPLLTSRFGDLYLLDIDGAILVVSAADGPMPPVNIGRTIGAWSYDDSEDKVIMLAPSVRRLLFAPRLFDGPIVEKDLPATVVLNGEPSIAVGLPRTRFQGKYFISSAMHQTIYQLVLDPATDRLIIEDMIQIAGLTTPTCVQPTNYDTLIISDGTQLHEVDGADFLVWQRSIFHGLPSGPKFALATSRSDFDPAIDGQPGWELIIDEIPDPEIPDPCPADWNADTLITSADITSFLTDWFSDIANGTTHADIDASGQTNSSDITYFLSLWFEAVAAGGC